jgi:hypothetical protein
MQQIIARAQQNKQRIVLPESLEERTLTAADMSLRDGLAEIILIGNPDLSHASNIASRSSWLLRFLSHPVIAVISVCVILPSGPFHIFRSGSFSMTSMP